MSFLFESGRYGSINTTDSTTNRFYVIVFTPDAYKILDNTTIDGKNIISGELVVKTQYIFSLQVNTNWCWDQHPQQHVITFPTRTILHLRLKVNAITDIQYITKSVCTRTQEIYHIKTSYMSY